MPFPTKRLLTAVVCLGSAVALTLPSSAAPAPDLQKATPGIACDKGSLPEKTQGRAPLSDVASGRYAKGYTCNAQQISHFGATGGYRVERYVDKAGHECAFYDSTTLFPLFAFQQGTDGTGTYVMDMSDPAHPVHTDTLRTPAMQSPHESLRLNQKRGLLVADMATPATDPAFVDVYDVTKDCRHPVLQSSSPMGVLGHEGGFSPDGNTFWVASLYAHTLAAVDLTNPVLPKLIYFSYAYQPHGVSISNDGNTLYMAEAAFGSGASDFSGLTVLDVSQVQKRVLNPTVPIISRLTWGTVSTPQNATPFTRHGRKYLMEIDEFGSKANIGAARIIDIQNIHKPFVVSNIRLAVNAAKVQGGDIEKDPGNSIQFHGYQGHYCSLPSRVDPTVLACSFIMSGLRVFDIANPAKPVEIAYFNKPHLATNPVEQQDMLGAFAMSAPAYDEKTGDIWYTDADSGFYVVRLTGAARRTHFASRTVLPGN
ncbi:MAG: hypothetical protein JWO12_3485 [Frankiales bacterium]|nr:hypothetical protein [Frankiales bacterium]